MHTHVWVLMDACNNWRKLTTIQFYIVLYQHQFLAFDITLVVMEVIAIGRSWVRSTQAFLQYFWNFLWGHNCLKIKIMKQNTTRVSAEKLQGSTTGLHHDSKDKYLNLQEIYKFGGKNSLISLEITNTMLWVYPCRDQGNFFLTDQGNFPLPL